MLPGEALVTTGLADLAEGRETVESLVVQIGRPRLRTLGYDVPAFEGSPELRLYELLGRRYGNAAHSRYNALIRRLVSFERAAACALRRP